MQWHWFKYLNTPSQWSDLTLSLVVRIKHLNAPSQPCKSPRRRHRDSDVVGLVSIIERLSLIRNFTKKMGWLLEDYLTLLIVKLVSVSTNLPLPWFCQAQGQTWNVKSKLDPEIGFVMGWSTHPPPPYNFFKAKNC